MENRKSKVFVSILLIVLCLSVCVGLTYAYFTDSAKSSGNKIQAGNLKLDLKLYDKVDDEWISIKNTEDPVFNYDKWEPGYVDAKLLKIENLGDLAMQWEAKLVSTEAVSAFANAIEVYVQKSDTEITYPADRAAALAWTKIGTLDQFINTAEKLANGTFTAQGEAYYIGIALYMPAEITDNTLQGQVLGAFDIQINATQLPYESDAFDENYDPDATFPNGGVTPPEDTEETTEPTDTEPDETTTPGEPTDDIEPTDPELFTWERNDDGNSYTVTGLVNPGTVENVVIPSTYNGLPVTAVENSAFYYDNTITSVTIPDGVTTIGSWAFYRCSNLQNIVVPDSITYIARCAFDNCNNMAYSVDNNACYIGNDSNPYVVLMKATDTSVESCNIHEDTKIIYDNAFFGCSSLQNITIPNSITYIGFDAFYGCDSLQYNEYDNAYYIGNDSNQCVVLMKAKDGDIELCDIHENTKIIYEGAFDNCHSLTKIAIPNKVIQIGNSAFAYCDGLTEITISNSVIIIGSDAFQYCNSVASIVIPDSVLFVDARAFNMTAKIYCQATTPPAGWDVCCRCGDNCGAGDYYEHEANGGWANNFVWGYTGE